MDRLPVEILDNICADHLLGKDLLSFRLVCRAFSEIAARYLLPEVSVAFLPHTLARLKSISEHPVISQHVQTITYQVDALPKIRSLREYKELVRLPVPGGPPILVHPHVYDADERTQRRHHREMMKGIEERVQASSRIATEGWKCYKDLYKQQETLLNSDMPMEVLEATLAKFPRLNRLRVQTRDAYFEKDLPMLQNPFKKSHVTPEAPIASRPPCGVLPLRNLLMGAYNAKTNLQELHAGYISFKFFDCDEGSFARIKSTVRYIRKLSMDIVSVDDRLSIAEEDENWEACGKLFDSGRFRDFLAAAVDLRVLYLFFDWPVTLDNVFGRRRWDFLRILQLGNVEMQEDALLAFFKRHATTLRGLALGDVTLTGPSCSFASVFLKIPEILDLDFTHFSGVFVSHHQRTSLIMETWVPWLDIPLGEAMDIVLSRYRLESLPEDVVGEDEDIGFLRRHMLARMLDMEGEDL